MRSPSSSEGVTAWNPVSPFRFLLKHRTVLWQLTIRNFETRHRGTLLGVAWSVLLPLVMLSLYVFVFGFIFKGRFGAIPDESNWDYGLGIFLGLTIFQFMSEVICSAPTLIASNPTFVKRVVFPLELIPAASVGAAVLHMLITLGMALLGTAFGGRITLGILLVPVVLAPLLFFALGSAWMFAALGVHFRDLAQLVGTFSTVLMFASAIFYPISQIPPEAWLALKLNPLIHTIEMTRDLVLWHKPIDGQSLAILYVCSFVVFVGGFAFFTRSKRSFADVI